MLKAIKSSSLEIGARRQCVLIIDMVMAFLSYHAGMYLYHMMYIDVFMDCTMVMSTANINVPV